MEVNYPVIIVSRHPGALEWLEHHDAGFRKALAERPHLIHVIAGRKVTSNEVRGNIVVGNLPLSLAAEAREYWAMELDDDCPRGEDLSRRIMERFHARLTPYKVINLNEAVRTDPDRCQEPVTYPPPEELQKAVNAVSAFLERRYIRWLEERMKNSWHTTLLINISEMRQHFTDSQIAAWIDYAEWGDKDKGWRVSRPSWSQETSPDWVKANLNSLLTTPRVTLAYYFFYQV